MKKLLAIAFIAALALSACGDKSDNGEDPGATAACPDPTPDVQVDGVPEGFPAPDDTHYTGGGEAGPSFIAEGYYDGPLQDSFEAYHAAFEDAGYDITKDEIEEHDAEVFFSGQGTTGQVNMYYDFDCESRTQLRITIRPE